MRLTPNSRSRTTKSSDDIEKRWTRSWQRLRVFLCPTHVIKCELAQRVFVGLAQDLKYRIEADKSVQNWWTNAPRVQNKSELAGRTSRSKSVTPPEPVVHIIVTSPLVGSQQGIRSGFQGTASPSEEAKKGEIRNGIFI